MSEFKGTPGDWELANCGDGSYLVFCGDCEIARVYSNYGTEDSFNGPGMEECIANARLIAAAPELLELAKDVVANNGVCAGTARALIARIEGGTT